MNLERRFGSPCISNMLRSVWELDDVSREILRCHAGAHLRVRCHSIIPVASIRANMSNRRSIVATRAVAFLLSFFLFHSVTPVATQGDSRWSVASADEHARESGR